MSRNMRKWAADYIASPRKKTIPVLSFPAVQLLDISVKEFISNSESQAKGLKAVADRVDTGATVSNMDLSLEAECFGSTIRVSDDEVPTVIGSIIEDEDEAEALEVPEVGSGRTQIAIDAMKIACSEITDRPVFAGCIGPFSLAGRLMDVTETMFYCIDEPEMVETVLEKCTEFIINYMNAYKETGADGVVMAEPLAGILSPSMAEEFSHPYVKRIIEAVQTDEFAVIYHNCGNAAVAMSEGIFDLGAMGYHFGDAIEMKDICEKAPEDVLVMGNLSPSKELRNGTPESVREATLKIMNECSRYPNFVISSGCDIPPMTPWENIDAFFAAIEEFYDSNL